jgi:alkylated DNA repair protein alkB family protein 6
MMMWRSLHLTDYKLVSLSFNIFAVALFDASIAPLPPILSKLAVTLKHTNAFKETPDHILINEYQKGMGIMSHTDGPAYNSRTATISIGGDVLFKLTKRRDQYNQLLLEEGCDKCVMEVLLHGCGSLIVFANDAYLNHCHGIDETFEETTGKVTANEKEGILIKRTDRISLTFRCKK